MLAAGHFFAKFALSAGKCYSQRSQVCLYLQDEPFINYNLPQCKYI